MEPKMADESGRVILPVVPQRLVLSGHPLGRDRSSLAIEWVYEFKRFNE